MANWRVIGKVYVHNKFYGNIIGLQGDRVTVEIDSKETDDSFEVVFSLAAMKEAGDRIEWVNVRPVNV